MFVSTFLYQVQVHLVSDVKLMASVAKAQLRGVPFITVTQNDAMEGTAHQESYGIVRTVGQAAIEQTLVVLVNQSPGNVASPCRSVILHEGRRLYS